MKPLARCTFNAAVFLLTYAIVDPVGWSFTLLFLVLTGYRTNVNSNL